MNGEGFLSAGKKGSVLKIANMLKRNLPHTSQLKNGFDFSVLRAHWLVFV